MQACPEILKIFFQTPLQIDTKDEIIDIETYVITTYMTRMSDIDYDKEGKPWELV